MQPSYWHRKLGGMVSRRRLLQTEPGYLTVSTGDSEGDLAESFEVNADGMQIVMKLHANAKWDQKPPTNSRPVDADDVSFSWNKFASQHNQRGNLANAV